MFSFLRGTIQGKDDHSLIVVCHDIGYRVFVSNSIAQIVGDGEHIELYLHHHIREDCSDLYGFKTLNDLRMYEQLLSLSGIGPKTALSILNAASSEIIARAVFEQNAEVLKAIPGIGAKTAERIVIELRGKTSFLHYAESDAQSAPSTSSDQDIIDALVQLGYQRAEAVRVVSGLPTTLTTPEERLKAALKALGVARYS